jgi:hypothetical protein
MLKRPFYEGSNFCQIHPAKAPNAILPRNSDGRSRGLLTARRRRTTTPTSLKRCSMSFRSSGPNGPTRLPTYSNEPRALGEVNSVDQQRQLEPAQIASHQFGESALGTDHEPLADRALADAANLNLLGQRFQRTRVTSGRDSLHHLLESSFIERIVRTPRLPENIAGGRASAQGTQHGSAATAAHPQCL